LFSHSFPLQPQAPLEILTFDPDGPDPEVYVDGYLLTDIGYGGVLKVRLEETEGRKGQSAQLRVFPLRAFDALIAHVLGVIESFARFFPT
jgi:hypothetical protein